jgi:hypothetical protein
LTILLVILNYAVKEQDLQDQDHFLIPPPILKGKSTMGRFLITSERRWHLFVHKNPLKLFFYTHPVEEKRGFPQPIII